MLQLERRLAERFPRWLRGRENRVALPLVRAFVRWSRLDRIETYLTESAAVHGLAFVKATLAFLQADYQVTPSDLARIPSHGRLLIVANHPSGALDALALLDAIGRVRQDVRIVANDVLTAITQLDSVLLPVRVFSGTSSVNNMKAIERALHAEQCVIVFPAGEVSRFSPRGVRDTRWRRGFVRFARSCGAPVLPVRVIARNSALFYGASTVFKPAGTALLAREMFERHSRKITLRVGEPSLIPVDSDSSHELRRIRRELYALKCYPLEQQALIPANDPTVLEREVQRLLPLGTTSDGKQIRVGCLDTESALLREIGRLRELTFRAVGEGTGRSLDLDAFDGWYEHIVLWDAPARRIAGAYRIARGAKVLGDRGLKGLYTASLFQYSEGMLPRLAQGMELGRSFVVPDYWGSRSIDYLWQGIGAYLRMHPKVRYLFGAVSMSAGLPVAAREQIVAYYSRYYGDAENEAASRRPFAYRAAPPAFEHLDADTSFRVLKANLDALGTTIPMLYKQYTELCEPGGARFLAFGIDPDFSDAVDGLIELDLSRVQSRKRRRYLEASFADEPA